MHPQNAAADLSLFARRAFLAVAREWNLDDAEQRALLAAGEDDPWHPLPNDRLLRISCVLGIYNALHCLFANPKQANSWIRRPNAAAGFDGRPALLRLQSSNLSELVAVRRYLDSLAHGC